MWRTAVVSLLQAETLKKPHFRKKYGVWSCATCLWHGAWCIGYGYTVDEAYDDWLKRFVPNATQAP